MPLRFPTRLLLAAAAIGCATTAQSQAFSEWLAPADGDWDDAANWSTPAFPNNGGGTTYAVLIAAGGGGYDIDLVGQSITLDSLTLNDSGAKLFIANGELTADTIDVMAGSLSTFNATVHAALLTSSAAGGPIVWETGTLPTVLDIARFSHSVIFERTGRVELITNLQLDDGVAVNLDSAFWLVDGASLSTPGQATIRINGSVFRTINETTVAEIGTGVNMEFIGGARRITGWIDHYGVIRADSNQNRGAILGRSTAEPFTNYGTIEAVNGGTITIGDQRNSRGFVNAGTLRADADSQIVFWGDVDLAAGSQFVGDGDFELLSGRLDFNGQSIDLDQFGSFTLIEGTLANGTVTGSGDAALVLPDEKIVFEAMTLAVDVHTNPETHDIRGGLTFVNGAEIQTAPTTLAAIHLRFTEAQTIDGNGRIVITADNDFSQLSMTQSSGAVVFDTGILIEAIGGDLKIGSEDKDWVNRGTIRAGNENTVTLFGNWSNQGLFQIESDANLILGGEFATSDLGVIDNFGGTLHLNGTLDNTGQTIDFTGEPGGVVRLGNDARVLGGTLLSSEGVTLTMNNRVFLEGVTIGMEVPVANRVSAVDSLTINNDFTIVAGDNDSSGRLTVSDDAGDGLTHLDGTGVIMFSLSASSPNARDVDITSFNSTLDIGSDLTIVMDEPAIRLVIGDDGNFDHHGTLDLSAGRTTLRSVWSSDGVIRTSGSAVLNLQGFYTTADLLTVDYQGGTVNVAGVLNNTGAVLRVDEVTDWLGQPHTDNTIGFTLVGGRVETGDGEALTNVRHLDGVTLAGDLWFYPEAGSTINNGLVFDNGTLHVNAIQLFLQSGAFTGNGTITFEAGNIHAPGTLFLDLPSGSILPVGLTVNTGGGSGEFGTAASSIAWTSDGTLQSLNPGRDLRITGDVTHNGSAHAANGGSITFENLTHHGTLLAEDGGVIRIEAGWTNPAGTISAESGGVIALGAWSATPGAFALDDGVVRVEFDTDLTQVSALPQAMGSAIEIAGELDLAGATLDLDAMTSMFRLNGGTLRDGAVTGASPLLVLNTTPAITNTLDGVVLFTDVTLADAGTTQLRNGTSFNAGTTVSGDGTLRVETSQTASFDAATIETDVVLHGGATMAITNGLTLDGVITSDSGTPRPQVRFDGTQMVTGTGRFQSAASAGLNLRFTGDLTLGHDIQLHALQGVLSFNGLGQALTINGRLEVAQSRTANINAGTFFNHGSLRLNAGGQLNIAANTVVNHGTIDLNSALIRAIDNDIQNTPGSHLLAHGTVDLGGDGTLRIAGEARNPATPGSRLVVHGHLELEETAQTTMTVFDNRSETLAFLHATGDVMLGGELTLDGESLTDVAAGRLHLLVLSGGTLRGAFERVTGLQIDPVHHWHLSYREDQLVAEVRVAGDANGDGLVGAADLDLILANWGDSVAAGDAAAGDWTGDGAVGQPDLQVVIDHWGLTASAPENGDVPEPGTLAMLTLLSLGLLRRRHQVS